MDPVAPSIEEIEARITEIDQRCVAIDREQAGAMLAGEALEEWNTINTERDQLDTLLTQLKARRAVIEARTSKPEGSGAVEAGASFGINIKKGADIWDVDGVRGKHSSRDGEVQELVDNAMRAIDTSAFPQADKASAQASIERIFHGTHIDREVLARRILLTGRPAYRRAFGKELARMAGAENPAVLTPEEQRALNTTTGSAGAMAVPFSLDATLVHTSSYSVNPFRAICRGETITTNLWKPVTSGAITASRASESTEATDNKPTLAQPSATPTKVQAFIPFTVEIEGDWAQLEAEMALLLQEAKDDEEAASFFNGNGTAPNAVGIMGTSGLGTAQRIKTAGTALFAIADVYSLQTGLTSRARPRASYLASATYWAKVRQFDTAGGAGLFAPTLRDGFGVGVGQEAMLNIPLVGRPAFELSTMSGAATSGTDIMLAGDFSRFVIVDRVGMNIEFVPHLLGTSRGYPTGERGIYCWWRNASCLLDAGAFRYLELL